jgi:hypothetical protein
VANESRAWQRTTKSGKTSAYVRVGDNSIRVSGDEDVVRKVLSSFAAGLNVELVPGPPAVVEGQMDIYEQLGQQA